MMFVSIWYLTMCWYIEYVYTVEISTLQLCMLCEIIALKSTRKEQFEHNDETQVFSIDVITHIMKFDQIVIL